MPYLSSFVQSTSLHKLTNLFLNVYNFSSSHGCLLVWQDEVRLSC